MRVLTCSRHFPKGHPKAGQPTYFVEKIWNCFRQDDFSLPDSLIPWTENYVTLLSGDEYLESIKVTDIKRTTIRAGNRWKAGDMASLRVWSGAPYRSKQIEFAQVEVIRTWEFILHFVGDDLYWKIPKVGGGDFDTLSKALEVIAKNDGLEVKDFIDWFVIHPKAKDQVFTGQIITWSTSIDYQ